MDICFSPKSRAHPRSRGDHYWCSLLKPPSSGSSPLARGPPARYGVGGQLGGLIPARAGTTCRRCRRRYFRRAHPRSRGDHAEHAGRESSGRGSSPLARGPQSVQTESLFVVGLIPARAGTTRFLITVSHAPRAHPRSRGDHPLNRDMVYVLPGSSPLARGPQRERRYCPVPVGLIPARAGTTIFLCAR